MRGLLVVVLAGGCGSVSGKDIDAAVGNDTGAHDVLLIDSPPPACNLSAAFGTPVNVGGVNSNSTDDWGWLSADALTIYFTSAATSSSDLNIYYATRAQPSGTFTGVNLLPGVNTTDVEDRPVVTADGLTLLAQSNASGVLHIYSATRATALADFSALTPVSALNSTAIDANPWVSADGLTVYLASTRAGSTTGDFDIFKATRPNTSTAFGTPTAVPELNMASTVDDAPVLSADGLEIFFASTRGQAGVSARNDIWHAVRSTTADGFGTPTKVAELSADTTEDFPSWLSPDRCTLVFSSDRTAGSNGGYDIWMATRPQ